jgi:hypothetical protein
VPPIKSLLPVVERLRRRFGIKRCCIVADLGMISAETIATPESPDCDIPYILGKCMALYLAKAAVHEPDISPSK